MCCKQLLVKNTTTTLKAITLARSARVWVLRLSGFPRAIEINMIGAA
jgi:hypothetical protein